MNKTQRKVLLVMSPIIVFFWSLGLADANGANAWDWADTWPFWVMGWVVLTAAFYYLARQQ